MPTVVKSSLVTGLVAAALAAPVALAQTADTRPQFTDYAIFEQQADAYWDLVAEQRRLRQAKRRNGEAIVLEDYVLTQPPVYTGPPRPLPPPLPGVPRRPIPVVADFVRYAAEHFKFNPQRPASEIDFKRAYVRVAAAAGLTR